MDSNIKIQVTVLIEDHYNSFKMEYTHYFPSINDKREVTSTHNSFITIHSNLM